VAKPIVKPEEAKAPVPVNRMVKADLVRVRVLSGVAVDGVEYKQGDIAEFTREVVRSLSFQVRPIEE
jgi:hypothetical protein